jgi:hypothetical protein
MKCVSPTVIFHGVLVDPQPLSCVTTLAKSPDIAVTSSGVLLRHFSLGGSITAAQNNGLRYTIVENNSRQ